MLGTSSSESVLPRMMAKMENLGVKKSTVGLVIPTGYSFNLDGTSIYLTMAAVFIAQATNTAMTLTQQLTLLAVLLLTSKGAAGVTGSGFIVLAATLSAVGHVPVAGLALILGIDRFMSEARALTNLIGNGVATVVVGKWCGELDTERMRRVLEQRDRRRGRGAGEDPGRRGRPYGASRPRRRCANLDAPLRMRRRTRRGLSRRIDGGSDCRIGPTRRRCIGSSSSAAAPAASSSPRAWATSSASATGRTSRWSRERARISGSRTCTKSPPAAWISAFTRPTISRNRIGITFATGSVK